MKIIESENRYHRQILPGIEIIQKEEGDLFFLNGQVLDEFSIDVSRERDMLPEEIITVTFKYRERI